MTIAETLPAAAAGELYNQIQLFYAEQMQLLDAGRAEEWARTFTDDGVFATNTGSEPVRGRAAIAAAAS